MSRTERTVRPGDWVTRRPVTFGGGQKLRRGKVVYVHPKGRFHIVEFGEPPRTFQESFSGTAWHEALDEASD